MRRRWLILIIIAVILILNIDTIQSFVAIRKEVQTHEGYSIKSQEALEDYIIVVIANDNDEKTFILDQRDLTIKYTEILIDDEFRRCLDNE